MATTVEREIDIDLPVREVYDQWTRFEEFPSFMSGVDEVRRIDDQHLHWRVSVGGVTREFDATITEQEADSKIAWRSTSLPRQSGMAQFEALGHSRTRLRVSLDWEPEGLVETVGAALHIDDAQVARDLQKFKRLVESDDDEDDSAIVGFDPDIEPRP